MYSAIRKSTQPIARPRSRAAKAKNQIIPDYNTMAGGSFKQLGSGIVPAGSGIVPAGVGIVPSGSGVIKNIKKGYRFSGSGARPAKGSQEARDKMAALRAMCKKK